MAYRPGQPGYFFAYPPCYPPRVGYPAASIPATIAPMNTWQPAQRLTMELRTPGGKVLAVVNRTRPGEWRYSVDGLTGSAASANEAMAAAEKARENHR